MASGAVAEDDADLDSAAPAVLFFLVLLDEEDEDDDDEEEEEDEDEDEDDEDDEEAAAGLEGPVEQLPSAQLLAIAFLINASHAARSM